MPAGLASTTPPAPRPPETQKPLTMPKLLWPEQLRWRADGRIDMKSLDMPFVLRKLLEWRDDHPDIIDIAGPPDPEDKNLEDENEGELLRRKAEAREWDEENDVRPYRLREWHAVEQKFPQPPHGIEGAAEHARILKKARKRLREELAAAAAVAAAAAAAAAGTATRAPSTPGSDDFRLRSPCGSASSMSGRALPPELLLGTSPGAAYVGSPRSLGRLSTLPKMGRPFADKDSYVGVTAQPSLRSSPRGAYGSGGGGSGAGRSWGIVGSSGSSGGSGRGDRGDGNGGSTGRSTPVAAAAAVAGSRGGGGGDGTEAGSVPEKAAKKKKARPEYERTTMSDKAFALYVPKWKEYDNSVDQVTFIGWLVSPALVCIQKGLRMACFVPKRSAANSYE